MPVPDRLERLTDLVLVLLHSPVPVTLDEIARTVPGYPDSHDARRQAFERDKRLLRDEGIPVTTVPVEGPEQAGYRIDPEAFYLPDLGLAADEQAALHLAVAGVHLGDPSGRDALAKLGALGVGEASPVAALAPPPALVPVFAALRSGAEVRFTYHGEARRVAPATVRFHGGRWYLVGLDAARAAPRTFRVDRIDGEVVVGGPGSGALPEGFTAGEAPVEPWRPAGAAGASGPAATDEDDHVDVRIAPVEAARVEAEVGGAAVIGREPDGAVVLRLGVWSPDVLRSWVLGLGEHAEVVGPPEARAAIVSWLESVRVAVPVVLPSGAAADVPPPGDAASSAAAPCDGSPGAPTRPTERTSAPPSPRRPAPASARLRRLLAVVGWLAEVGEASIAEVSARFGIPEDEVARELELAACCGVPPYSPDVLLEILVTRDRVQAFLPKELARPRRLTPAEGLALAASARTILAVPGADGDGALGRALAKLESALGDRGRLVIDLDAPTLLGEVRAVTDAGVQVEIEYHSASSGTTGWRRVEPLAVLSLDGHWYLDAFSAEAAGLRRFRVDRISGLRRLGEPVVHRDAPGVGRPEVLIPGPGSRTVRLALGPEAQWVLGTIPTLAEERRADGTVEVSLAVGGVAWLERLLVQLGPQAQVLHPPDLVGAAAGLAGRMLARYRLAPAPAPR